MNRMLSLLFRVNEKIVIKLSGWKHIPYSDTNFMYLAPHIHKGKTITLSDGTLISLGDWIAELHIDNLTIGAKDTRYPNLLRLLQGEITALSRALREDGYSKIKAVYGISVFHEIAARQGFTIREIESPVKRSFATLWENILRAVFKKENKRGRRKYVKSKECWLSKGQIFKMNKGKDITR